VAYGDAELSVPTSWRVIFTGEVVCAPQPPGFIYLGPVRKSGGVCGSKENGKPSSTAALTFLATSGAPALPSIQVRGIKAYVKATGPRLLSYVVPSLHVTVTTMGPLMNKVVDTLSASPRALVLAPGPPPAVPSSWRWLSFAGLRFSVPASWPLDRTNTFNQACLTPTSLSTPAQTTMLNTDQNTFVPPCVPVPQWFTEPVDGLDINSGLGGNLFGILPGQCAALTLPSARGLPTCEDEALPYGVLTLRVTLPKHPKPVFVSIGLAGNGMVAWTILHSLRAA
jgi:hypothetical protein